MSGEEATKIGGDGEPGLSLAFLHMEKGGIRGRCVAFIHGGCLRLRNFAGNMVLLS